MPRHGGALIWVVGQDDLRSRPPRPNPGFAEAPVERSGKAR
jgi:hypothetical protein